MKFEDLGTTWRTAGAAGGPPDLSVLRQRAEALERVVRWRDRIEIGAALVVLPIFGWVSLYARSGLSRIGAGVIALACVLIPIRLRLARREGFDPARPVIDVLRTELSRVEAQRQLLGSVFWWYFAPLGIGLLFFTAGAPVGMPYKVAYLLVVAVFFAWLIHLNHKAASEQLAPIVRDLEAWIAELADAPSSGTDRPSP